MRGWGRSWVGWEMGWEMGWEVAGEVGGEAGRKVGGKVGWRLKRFGGGDAVGSWSHLGLIIGTTAPPACFHNR